MLNVTERIVFNHVAEQISHAEKAAEKLVDQTANHVARRASELSPRDTGEEAGSYVVSGEGDKRTVTNTSHHFPFQELGTRLMPAHPALTPAANEEDYKGESESVFKEALK